MRGTPRRQGITGRSQDGWRTFASRVRRGFGPYLGSRRSRVALLVATALLGGFVEAGLLFLIIKTALSVGGPASSIDLHIAAFRLSVDPSVALVVSGVLLGLSLALAYINSAVSAKLSTEVVSETRKRLAGAFLQASWSVQAREREGRLVEVLSGHTNRVSQGVLTLSNALSAACNFLALVVVAAIINVLASGVVLTGTLTLALLLFPLTRLTKRRAQAQRQASLQYVMSLAQTIRLTRELRVFDVLGSAESALALQTEEVASTGYTTRLLGKLTPSVYKVVVLGLLLLGLAAVLASGAQSVSDLGAVVVLMVRALSYSQTLNSSVQQLSEVAPYLADSQALEEGYRLDRALAGNGHLDRVQALSLRSCSFAYPGNNPVLHEVDLTAQAGECLGVVGPSGSGKSTLVQILLRLRAPATGSYTVNAVDAGVWSPQSWSQNVTFVPQENKLLRATVADNIRFLRTGATVDDVERAAQLSYLHDDILALPQGYDTVIGPGARDLSGGQLQRLGLARALLLNPSVLVLDEPTSSLDMYSEMLVQKTLSELVGRVTLVIVAHRMSTLAICDKILVLVEGRVAAFGSPQEVMRSNEFYKNAVRLAALPS